jgi:acyl carrier protein
MEIESIPLNANGKVDRKALPDPGLSALARHHYEGPQNELQFQLQEIWQELLGTEQVGIRDNFFELGGHSLLAMRMVAGIRKGMDMELHIRMIFQLPTIQLLSRTIGVMQENFMLETEDFEEIRL